MDETLSLSVGDALRLDRAARLANLTTRSASKTRRYKVVNHIAIEDLKAWYFGDWQAVKAAYPRVNANIPLQAKFRSPDEIKGNSAPAPS